jgi:lipopolysaccharide export system permease protein
MGILGRYIISEILKVVIPVWLSLGFLFFLMEWLSNVFNSDAEAGTVFLLYLYKVPSYLQLVFPIAVLFAFLLVLGNMARSREVVAVQSLGYGQKRILAPCLIALLIASIPYYWVIDSLSPGGLKRHFELFDDTYNRGKSRFLKVRQEKIWFRNKDVLYTIRWFDPKKKEMYDVTLYTFDDDFHIAQTVQADKATWNKNHWVLSKGTVYVSDKRLRTPVTESFVTRKSRLMEDPAALTRVELVAESLSQSELKASIDRSRALGINTAKWEVLYHSRYSFFVIAFVFILLAFPRAMRFHRSGGAAKDGVFVAGTCLVYWLIFNFGVNLGNAGRVNPLLAAWAPSFVFALGIYLYNRTLSLRNTSD